MAQFTRSEAEEVRAEVIRDYPQLRVGEVMDVVDQETSEYQWSFFSIGKGAHHFVTNVSSLEQYGIFLAICEYVAQVRADLRQEAGA